MSVFAATSELSERGDVWLSGLGSGASIPEPAPQRLRFDWFVYERAWSQSELTTDVDVASILSSNK